MLSNLLLPLLFACIFQNICQPISAQLSGEFDLQMSVKGHLPPYPPLNDLQMVDGNIVPAARHHIIPRNRLREFYNKAVVENQIQNLRLFLTEYKEQFKQVYKTDSGRFSEAIKNTEQLIDGIIAGTVVHADGKPKPKNYSFFIGFYMWLPENIFVGPRTEYRSDDPKEEFESDSKPILGENDFNERLQINNEMKEYISQGNVDFTKLDTDLQRMLATRNGGEITSLEAYPFNKEQWVPAPEKGTYKIKA